MAFVGYARVSTIDQDLSIQLGNLNNAGCKKIFSEKISGNSKINRKELDLCLEYLREGDTLVVTRIDRLSRSLRDLQNLVYELNHKGIYLMATEQPIDTSTAAGKAFLDMLGVFSEFETNLRKERQLEGIAKAKKEGKYKGRQPTAQRKKEEVIDLIKKGFTRKETASTLGIGIASVYRILKTYTVEHPNDPLPGSRSGIKIATLNVRMIIENNSKFVRGKGISRQRIEDDWSIHYQMKKIEKDGWDYILKIPYKTEEELDKDVEDLIFEAHSIADLKNGFVEIDVVHNETGKNW